MNLTARQFATDLTALQSDFELAKIQKYFKRGPGEYGEGDEFLGVRMGQLFSLAKTYIAMPLPDIETLLESPIHEFRAGACSIMDKQARVKKTTEVTRQQLYELYLRWHDRINNWDLVDVCAPHVIGGFLMNKSRTILRSLALSFNMWERRTAMVATFYFVGRGQVDDTFEIAEMLLRDPEDLIHKAVGGGLRYAGTQDRGRLVEFLDRYSATMPRVMLRYAVEHFDEGHRTHYLAQRANTHSKR